MAPPNPYAYAPPPPSPYQPYAAPVADPYGGYLGPPPEAPPSDPTAYYDEPPAKKSKAKESGMPPPPRLAQSPLPGDTRNSATSKAGGCGAFIKLVPFGSGQFCAGKTMKGLFFLGSEVVSLYFYKANTDASVAYQSKLNTILADRETARADVAESDLEAYDAETAAKESQGKAAITKAKQNAQYSMISFAGLWGIGVIDAFINSEPSKPVKKSKKKSPRVMHSYNLDLDKAPLGTWAMTIQDDSKNLTSDYLLGYTPTVDARDGNLLHSLTLGMSWEL